MLDSFWELDALGGERNASLCEILQRLPNATTWQDVVNGRPPFSVLDTAVLLPNTPYRPVVVSVISPGQRNIFLAGIDPRLVTPPNVLPRQLHELVDSWDDRYYSRRIASGANPLANQEAAGIVTACQPFVPGNTDAVKIVGYSYGGMIAPILGQLIKGNNPGCTVEVITYGAPRPGHWRFQQRATSDDVKRFWNTEDPIPFTPPHVDECPWMAVFFSTRTLENMDAQVQITTGYQVYDTGIISASEGLTAPSFSVTTGLVQLMTGSQGIQATAHTLAEYVRRFNLATARTPPRPIPVPPVGVRQRADPETPAEIDRARQANVPVVNAGLNGGGGPPISVIATPGVPDVPVTPGDPPLKYRARKRGTIWVVEHAGEVVGVGPHKRRARSLARRLNRARTAIINQ